MDSQNNKNKPYKSYYSSFNATLSLTVVLGRYLVQCFYISSYAEDFPCLNMAYISKQIKSIMPGAKIFEGVFGESSLNESDVYSILTLSLRYAAIDKPPSITSAQVVRDLQRAFNPSSLFAPLLAAEKAARDKENSFQKRRRRDKQLQVKIGHGGTLDPLATGVLVIGVGKGTKQLQKFLECTKSYEATLLFGAATDTYDVAGKLIGTAPYDHISRETVETAIAYFRGNIKQRPPIYSSLRIEGKRLYEYAREGKELPREIQERVVRVDELQILEWLSPGSHGIEWPTEHAPPEGKALIKTLDHDHHDGLRTMEDIVSGMPLKRKCETTTSDDDDDPKGDAMPKSKRQETSFDRPIVDVPEYLPKSTADMSTPFKASCLHQETAHGFMSNNTEGPPAVKLKMTVTSGFYVRSLCHDLGKALASLGLMVALVRTRQGDFELGQNVLAYDDLARGEDVWSPKVQSMLESWQENCAFSESLN